jgi:hypothetical protein
VTHDVEKLVVMFWARPEVMRLAVTKHPYYTKKLGAFRKIAACNALRAGSRDWLS